MDEQNKQPEQNKPEKKLSRTTLTFYIVGLFSVAIALILISYVAQSRADKQVENLSSQLTQQLWTVGILTPEPQAEKILGLKALSRRKLYNADIPCVFYTFT